MRAASALLALLAAGLAQPAVADGLYRPANGRTQAEYLDEVRREFGVDPADPAGCVDTVVGFDRPAPDEAATPLRREIELMACLFRFFPTQDGEACRASGRLARQVARVEPQLAKSRLTAYLRTNCR